MRCAEPPFLSAGDAPRTPPLRPVTSHQVDTEKVARTWWVVRSITEGRAGNSYASLVTGRGLWSFLTGLAVGGLVLFDL